MAGKKALLCAECGTTIVGQPHIVDGKAYCEACYQKLMQARISLNRAKAELYDYIKTLFGVSECPDSVKHGIDRALDDGKKLPAIRYTIYFYYQVQENTPVNIQFVPWVVNTQYEEAKKYAAKIKKLAEDNAKVDINQKPDIIKVAKPKLTKKLSRINVEDLIKDGE